MPSRLVSLVAVPASLVGHLLFWSGSALLLRGMMQSQIRLDAGAFALAVIGVLVIIGAVATVAIGSLGAYIVGGVQVLFSLLLHLVPLDFANGGFSPAFEVMTAVRTASTEVSDGMFFYFPPGIGAVTGVIFLAAAYASDRRRTVQPMFSARAASTAAGVVGVAGLALALGAGARVYVRQLVMLAGAEPLDLVLLYLGVVLVAAAVVSARWSSAGALLAGAVVTVLGVLGFAVPTLFLGLRGVSAELGRGLDIALPSGGLLLIGLLLVAAGLAVRARARRLAGLPGVAGAAATEPPPPAGPPSV